MRLRYLIAILVPAALLGATPKVAVQVTARVPLVATVNGPAQVVLAPGEVARIQVSVAANVPWTLAVHSPNDSAVVLVTLNGPAGGARANTRDVELSCPPQAPVPQTIALVYTLMPR